MGDVREEKLEQLLTQYGASLPDLEPTANFMPGVWARIEARREVRFRLIHLSRVFLSGAAAIWLLIAGVQFLPKHEPAARHQSYVDALAATHESGVLTFAEAVHLELGEPNSR